MTMLAVSRRTVKKSARQDTPYIRPGSFQLTSGAKLGLVQRRPNAFLLASENNRQAGLTMLSKPRRRENTKHHQPQTGQRTPQKMITTLPDNLDWSAEYLIPQPPDENGNQLDHPSWIHALMYDTSDVRDFVENGGLYHERVSDTFLVAYNFSFTINAAGDVVAKGVTHPAVERNDNYYTDESAVIHQTDIIIRQHQPEAGTALRRYIREHHLGQLPDTLHGFPQPADAKCLNCTDADADDNADANNAGSRPVLHCPACERTFCDSCTDITTWRSDAVPACPHCGHTPQDGQGAATG